MQQTQTIGLHQTLAPQLQQSLHILQAPALELRQLIRQELETNPVLEEEPVEREEDEKFDEEFEELARLDDEWREFMSQNQTYTGRSEELEEKRRHFFESLTIPETLQQHLMDQLRGCDLTTEQHGVAELIIGNIDENGYLQSAPENMASRSGIPVETIQEVLDIVQGFDPPGVAARDLKDCLLLQLRHRGRENSLEYRLVEHHMDDLARHRYPRIARKAGISKEQVQYAANAVARLDPRPGRQFATEPSQYIRPDLTVERDGDGYSITLNNEQIPHLRISNAYKDLMSKRGEGREVKNYIRDKIRGGKFIIKSIHQRQETIQKIAREIVERQREFFDLGPAFLRPMNMSQVAEAVGVHETTVSRAVSGKYMATPQGIYELRYFFTPGYESADGAELSNTSVKEAIVDLIRNEDSSKPLSDQQIVELLAERGIPIARRTVAKYRGEAHILPANMRRKY